MSGGTPPPFSLPCCIPQFCCSLRTPLLSFLFPHPNPGAPPPPPSVWLSSGPAAAQPQQPPQRAASQPLLPLPPMQAVALGATPYSEALAAAYAMAARLGQPPPQLVVAPQLHGQPGQPSYPAPRRRGGGQWHGRRRAPPQFSQAVRERAERRALVGRDVLFDKHFLFKESTFTLPPTSAVLAVPEAPPDPGVWGVCGPGWRSARQQSSSSPHWSAPFPQN